MKDTKIDGRTLRKLHREAAEYAALKSWEDKFKTTAEFKKELNKVIKELVKDGASKHQVAYFKEVKRLIFS